MRWIQENPRKTIILVLYGLLVVGAMWLKISIPMVIVAYGLLTLILVAVFHADCIAYIGILLYGRGRADQATAFFRVAIAHKAKTPAAYLYYAIYLVRRGQAAEANGLLDIALTLNPKIMTHKNIQLTKASCMWVLGDVDKAIEILEHMRKLFDYVNAGVLSTLGYMYFLKDDLEQAESLSRAAIAESPESAAAWDNLGQIFLKQNAQQKAKEAFEKALTYKTDMASSLYYLGCIAESTDGEAAADYFKRAADCSISSLNTVTREQVEEKLRQINTHQAE